MATLVGWNRLILSGTIADAEVWSTSIAFADVTSANSIGLTGQSNLQDVADTVRAGLVDAGIAQAPFDLISPSANIQTVRVEARDTTGLLGVAESSFTVPASGGGPINMPPQCAVVVSLLTGVPGRRYRGRMYLPCMSAEVGTNFRLATLDQQAIADDMATLIQEWQAAFNAGTASLTPVVVSETGLLCTEVQQLRVGNVIDTQRRRRDTLLEDYVTASL